VNALSVEFNFIQNFTLDAVYARKDVFKNAYVFTDNNNVLQDPDSFTLKLTAPDQATTVTVSPTRLSTGSYQANWIIPANAQLGRWTLIVTAIRGLKSQTTTTTFLIA
jgi:hypothetical protein